MDEEREKVIARFLESDHISNMQFKQYFKGFELLRHWMMKHHSLVFDFTNLDLEVVDIEILADEANERERVKPLLKLLELLKKRVLLQEELMTRLRQRQAIWRRPSTLLKEEKTLFSLSFFFFFLVPL